MPGGTLQRAAPSRGLSLLEVLAALVLASLAVGLAIEAGRSWKARASLEAARVTTLLALLEARRQAYLTEETSELHAEPGANHLTVVTAAVAAHRLALPAGVTVANVSRGGRIRFFPSGLAENATIRLALGSESSGIAVVTNQRGEVR